MDRQEAIQIIKKNWPNGRHMLSEALEFLIPELKESEDEKIRKELITWLKNSEGQTLPIDRYNAAIAWLEKQGEQKLTEKVEPKFKVDDWVIDKQGIVHQIANVIEIVTNHTYGYDIVGGGYFNDNIEGVRLWTIQDAKDGDVLATHLSPEGDWIGIYKESVDILGFKTYCFLNGVGEFVINPNRCRNHGTHGLHPATKEQRDLLFTKMKEEGYEWDAEKKELKEIEQKQKQYDIDILEKHITKDSISELAHTVIVHNGWEIVDAKEQKPIEWSEEDESMLNLIIAIFEVNHPNGYFKANELNDPNMRAVYTKEIIIWLKSLKERMKGE